MPHPKHQVNIYSSCSSSIYHSMTQEDCCRNSHCIILVIYWVTESASASFTFNLKMCAFVWYHLHELDVWRLVAEPPLSPTSGRVEGEVKLSISYRNSTLFIMVMHIRDLVNTAMISYISRDTALTRQFIMLF